MRSFLFVPGDSLRKFESAKKTAADALILDLEEVPYIDSTALGIILRAHATVTRRGGALRLLHVDGHVRELLELTRLLSVLGAFDSEADAIASVKSIPAPDVSTSG
jgi:anti-anti-sigma factor